MMSISLRIWLLTVTLISISPLAFAEDFNKEDTHQHAENHSEEHEFELHTEHQHGAAIANLSLESHILQLDLLIAANDLFGFEHSPVNQEQHTAVDSALQRLKDVASVITLEPACEPMNQTTETQPQLNDEQIHEQSGQSHSDILSIYLWDCSTTSPQTINFGLFSMFPAIKIITVQFISSDTQLLDTVTPDSPAFNFPN